MLAAPVSAQTVLVAPSVETPPVPSSGDAADDPAIWIHPTNPASSVVVGTDKKSGLAVYDLAGSQLQFLAVGNINNVDLRFGFPLGGGLVDLATGSNRTNDTISAFSIDPSTGLLTSVAAGSGVATGLTVYGYCMYVSGTGRFYGFVDSKNGDVEQHELFDDGTGHVTGSLVRSFAVGSQTEGCVADDETGALYIGEENVGIWRYGAEPGDGTVRTLIDSTGVGGHLTADVEGLAIYYEPGGSGYLIASSQGSDTYTVYERSGANPYVGTFAIVDGIGIDGASDTDGIDVTSAALGAAFPAGLLVVQDGANPGANQNFKFVKWDDIALAFSPPLRIDTTWHPLPGCSAGTDDDGDEVCDDVDICLGFDDPDQIDTDQDGFGNRCDADYDGDGFVGGSDFLVFRSAFGTNLGEPLYDPETDSDGDDSIGSADFLNFRATWHLPPGPSALPCAGTPPCLP